MIDLFIAVGALGFLFILLTIVVINSILKIRNEPPLISLSWWEVMALNAVVIVAYVLLTG